VVVRVLIFAGLSILSVFVAVFFSAFGPSPFYMEYVPRGDTFTERPIAGTIAMAVLWAPVLYLLWVLVRSKLRSSAD
jgi:hypothetical protein